MSLKLIRISIILFFVLLFFGSLEANQIIFEKNVKDNDFDSGEYISEIGEQNEPIFLNIFNQKNYKDIKNFLAFIPSKNFNPVIQDLIFRFLKSKKLIDRNFVSIEEDQKIFELYINQLFETGRINEIELFYSQYPNLKDNEFILKKMIEGNLLRNRHNEACKILDNKSDKVPELFGKILIICDIINNRFDEAKLGLLLLKERNEPGDLFFIDLAYSLMSDKSISEEEGLKKKLNEVKSLNPIIMSSLQFADISPNYEQIDSLSISGLLSILSNPTVETDLKVFCSEILVKQQRIEIDMLSQAYQLSRFKSSEIENSLKIYKTLSPAKARPLLYQSILKEKNVDVRLKKIIAILKISKIDNMFRPISILVSELIPKEIVPNSNEELLLLSRMYQSKKNFLKAFELLELADEKTLQSEVLLRKISLSLNQSLTNGFVDEEQIFSNLKKVNENGKFDSEKLKKILIIIILNTELPQTLIDVISNLKLKANDKSFDFNFQDFLLAEKLSSKKDVYNSLRIFFKINLNKDFQELNMFDTYRSLKVLKNLELNEYFKQLSEHILQ
ncbi:MAG: hypothetical protein CNE97_03550 [alpha proteobacterium MED-G10]|nr:MAG: hypothetical protein CNE97_03550 [alpha proteobacterium MED-G10]